MALTLDINANTKQAQASIKGFAGVLRTALGTALGFITANAIPRMIGAIGDLVNRTSDVNAITTGFKNLSAAAGLSADAMLEQLRPATQGLISDFDLMKQTNNALALDIISSEEQWADLAGAAVTLGRAVGLDAAQAIESLTVGIGRQSRMMLDNLGVIVKAEDAYELYAEKIGKPASALTDLEKKTAFAEEATRKIILKAGEAGDAHLALGDRLTIAKNAMSNWIDKTLIAIDKNPVFKKGIDDLAEAFTGSTEAVEGADSAVQILTESLGLLLQALAKVTESLGWYLEKLGAFQTWMEDNDQELIDWIEWWLGLDDAFRRIVEPDGRGGSLTGIVDELDNYKKAQQDANVHTEAATRSHKDLHPEIFKTKEALEKEEQAFKDVTRAKDTYDGLVLENVPMARDMEEAIWGVKGALDDEAGAFDDVTDAKGKYDDLVETNIPAARDLTEALGLDGLAGTVGDANGDGKSLTEAFGSAEDAFGSFIQGLAKGKDPIDLLKSLLYDLLSSLLRWLLTVIPAMQYFIQLLGMMGIGRGPRTPYNPKQPPGPQPYAFAGAGAGVGAGAASTTPVPVPLIVDAASVRQFTNKVGRELRDRVGRNVDWV